MELSVVRRMLQMFSVLTGKSTDRDEWSKNVIEALSGTPETVGIASSETQGQIVGMGRRLGLAKVCKASGRVPGYISLTD